MSLVIMREKAIFFNKKNHCSLCKSSGGIEILCCDVTISNNVYHNINYFIYNYFKIIFVLQLASSTTTEECNDYLTTSHRTATLVTILNLT